MKKNDQMVWIVLIVLFLFLYNRTAAYAAAPPPVKQAPIRVNLIQGGALPGLVAIPKNPNPTINKVLTDYRTNMQNYLTALSKSYVSTSANANIVARADRTNYESIVREFITQHNAYFKAKPTTNLCTWYYALNNVSSSSIFLNTLVNETPLDPGLKPLVPFLNELKIGTAASGFFLQTITDRITSSVAGNC